MSYPYSKRETIADGIVHGAGLLFAFPAVVMLLQKADGGVVKVAAAIYGTTLIVSLVASAIYHLSPLDGIRDMLGRIDHAAIYFKIAGTYTPVVAVIGSVFAYGVLGIVVVLAIMGAVAKLRGWGTNARGSLPLYLGMGWLSVLLIRPMWLNLPGVALTLILVGGMVYSLGTIIYSRNSMPYQNAIWHTFVLTASICFFTAIFLSV